MTILETAIAWHEAGFHVVRAVRGKRPAEDWKDYQDTRRPTAEQVIRWASTADGIGVITGTDKQLEMLEVEGRAADTVYDITELAEANGLLDLWTRVYGGYCEQTPAGGLHWYYRVAGVARANRKLARRPTDTGVDVLWETRGQGGFSVIAPSGGSIHDTIPGGQWKVIHGSPAGIPTITEDERDALHALIAMLDEMPPAAEPAALPRGGMLTTDGLRPGDDYNQRATWDDVLTPHGWRRLKKMGTGWTWQRPGKTGPGISATTGQAKDGVDRLYVFTTSTLFESEKPYGKFAAYALLNHGGDYSSAGRALRALGYGEQRTATVIPLHADQPPPPAPTDDLEDALFGATDMLGIIRVAARARLVSPPALLGAVLARVVAEVNPCVALPAIIGTRASLNLYVAIVGPSGATKTTAAGVADDLLLISEPVAKVQGTGSGEGLIASYLRKNPDPDDTREPYVLRDHPHVCMLIDEIGMLGSIQGRNGSTLAPVLRSGWSGSALETINADPTRKRIVPKMHYRLTAIAGVQPLASDVLFDDADTGTPQRWIWMPALDPRMPDEAPEWPGPTPWAAPSLNGWQHHGLVTMRVPEHVSAGIRAAHRARHRGHDTNHMDGHLALTRLKVAAALAILHGGYEVTDQMWDLAGLVMDISMRVRTECQQSLAEEAGRRAERRGRMDHAREIGRAEAVAETVEKDAKRVWRKVYQHGGNDPGANRGHPEGMSCSRRCVTAALTRRDADQKAAAVAHAVAMAWLTEDPDGRLSLGSSAPAEAVP